MSCKCTGPVPPLSALSECSIKEPEKLRFIQIEDLIEEQLKEYKFEKQPVLDLVESEDETNIMTAFWALLGKFSTKDAFSIIFKLCFDKQILSRKREYKISDDYGLNLMGNMEREMEMKEWFELPEKMIFEFAGTGVKIEIHLNASEGRPPRVFVYEKHCMKNGFEINMAPIMRCSFTAEYVLHIQQRFLFAILASFDEIFKDKLTLEL